MESELYPAVEIQKGTFNILVAPVSVVIDYLRRAIGSNRFLMLFICGNYSRILSRLNLRTADFDVRRAFTAFQLLSILEEAHQGFVFVEHDPTLYEEMEGLIDYVSRGMKDLAANSATVMLYSPQSDDFLLSISKMADRVFYLNEGVRKIAGDSLARAGRRRKSRLNSSNAGQTRLEVF